MPENISHNFKTKPKVTEKKLGNKGSGHIVRIPKSISDKYELNENSTVIFVEQEGNETLKILIKNDGKQ